MLNSQWKVAEAPTHYYVRTIILDLHPVDITPLRCNFKSKFRAPKTGFGCAKNPNNFFLKKINFFRIEFEIVCTNIF